MTDSPKPCECEEVGWCPRHCMLKTVTHHRLCQNDDHYRRTRDASADRALGNRIEKVFKAVGLTKEQWKEIKAKFGMPRRCACDSRRDWLNKVGSHLHVWKHR